MKKDTEYPTWERWQRIVCGRRIASAIARGDIDEAQAIALEAFEVGLMTTPSWLRIWQKLRNISG